MDPFAVIVPAAGQSTRFGDSARKKIFHDLDGRAVWLRSIEPFVNRDDVIQIILAIAPSDREMFDRRYGANAAFLNLTLVAGGASRTESVASALAAVRPEARYIAVHDAARPCVSAKLIDAVFAAALSYGAALPGLEVTDTLKRIDSSRAIVETIPRAGLVAVQTPQAFRRNLIERAYAKRGRGAGATDDAQLVEAAGTPCHVVEGDPANIKITHAIDLKIAAAILRQRQAGEKPASLHPFTAEQPPGDADLGTKRRFEDLL
jgi:2-C-methyl-D-erythritol 4-phosphate cytidylyltransferase